jgi:hypothetical protein
MRIFLAALANRTVYEERGNFSSVTNLAQTHGG